jgi:hypothetical protein
MAIASRGCPKIISDARVLYAAPKRGLLPLRIGVQSIQRRLRRKLPAQFGGQRYSIERSGGAMATIMQSFASLLDWSGLLAAPTLFIILGSIFLLVAISGGDVKFKGLGLPKISVPARVGAGVVGVVFASLGVYSAIWATARSPLQPGNIAVDSLDCSQSAKSDADKESSQPTTIEFKNDSETTLTGFWMKYNGESEEYFKALPHQSKVQNTFVGNVWVLRDDKGSCVAVFRASMSRAVIRNRVSATQ